MQEYIIDAGIFGKFSFTIDDDTTSAIYRNGKFFLPWHISAALTSNGEIENSWLRGKTQAEIVSELLKMRSLYQCFWYSSVEYVKQLTGHIVY